MARYSEDVIETIKNRLTMSEVVSPYVRLTRKGDRYWGLCPFHKEKTGSFTVVDNGGTNGGFYKCFGCGKGGGIFNFIMEMEHVEFPEAIEILAKKAGVELTVMNEAEKKVQNKSRALAELYDRLCKYLHKYLLSSSSAQHARDYIKKRGISDEICEKFLLGYAPNSYEWMYGFLKKHNYSDELLKESGLFNWEYNKAAALRERIMFPIRNWKGECVAFSGRDLTGESKQKYKNSPETAIYSKKNIVYGFYEAIPALKEKKEIIICEGNFDVISLHQAGISNSVATCGTALTDEQLKLIARYCDKVYMLYDSDAAGQNATKKALMACQRNGLANFVIKLEGGAKDINDVLMEEGAEAITKCTLNAVTGFSYLVSSALKLYDIRRPKGKASVFEEVKPYLDVTSSSIERQGYIRYLSNVLRVPEEQVTSDFLKQHVEQPVEQDIAPANKKAFNPLKTSYELTAMLILLKHRELFEDFRSKVKYSNLSDENAQALYTVLEDSSRQDIRTDDMMLQMIEDQNLRNLAVTAFTSEMYDRMDVKKTLQDAVVQIKLRKLEESRAMVQRMLNSGDLDATDDMEFGNLLQMKMNLDKEIQDLRGNMEDKD